VFTPALLLDGELNASYSEIFRLFLRGDAVNPLLYHDPFFNQDEMFDAKALRAPLKVSRRRLH